MTQLEGIGYEEAGKIIDTQFHLLNYNSYREMAIHKYQALVKAEARVKELEEEQEKLVWNLGGISVIACSRDLNNKPVCRDWVKPALDDVISLVERYIRLEAKFDRLRESGKKP